MASALAIEIYSLKIVSQKIMKDAILSKKKKKLSLTVQINLYWACFKIFNPKKKKKKKKPLFIYLLLFLSTKFESHHFSRLTLTTLSLLVIMSVAIWNTALNLLKHCHFTFVTLKNKYNLKWNRFKKINGLK